MGKGSESTVRAQQERKKDKDCEMGVRESK